MSLSPLKDNRFQYHICNVIIQAITYNGIHQGSRDNAAQNTK